MKRTQRTRGGVSIVAIGALCVGGCSGTIGETQSRGGAGSGRTGIAGSTVGGGGVVVEGDAVQDTRSGTELHPTAQSLRIQQHRSRSAGRYDAPADDFPSEEKRLGFDNNAALQISPVLAEQYMLSAEKLAAAAVTKMSSLLAAIRQRRRGRVRQVFHRFVRCQSVSSRARRR